MKLGYSIDPNCTTSEDELIGANDHVMKNSRLAAFDATESYSSTSSSLSSEDNATNQHTEEDDERNRSIWNVFVEEENEVSTIDNPSFLSEETSELEGLTYASSSLSSSDERDGTTATSAFTSGYAAYGCCCGGGVSDDEASAYTTSFDCTNLHEEQPIDLREDQDTARALERPLDQSRTDEKDNLSRNHGESRDSLLRDEERLELETQQVSRDQVLIWVESICHNVGTEETIDGRTIWSSNTGGKQSSLLRNIFFKRSSKGSESEQESNHSSRDADVVEGSPKGEKPQELLPSYEGTISPSIAALGGVGLLLASMLSTNQTAMNDSKTQENEGNESQDAGVPTTLQKFEQVNGLEPTNHEKSLNGEEKHSRVSPWHMFMAVPRHDSDIHRSSEIVPDLKPTEEPSRSRCRCRSLTPSISRRIGQRIEQAKAKSEARRNFQKTKQLELQALDRHLKETRKNEEGRDLTTRKASTSAQAKVKSSRTTSSHYVPTSLCASMEVFDSILVDPWERQPPRDRVKQHYTIKENEMQRKRQSNAKSSRRRHSSGPHRSSLKSPLCGAELAFQAGMAMEKRKRSRSKQRLSQSKLTKNGNSKVEALARRPDNRSSRRRSKSLSRTTVPPLCGAAIPFSVIDDDAKRRRQRRSRSATSRGRSVSKDRITRKAVSDFERRTSSQTKPTWRMAFLGKSKDKKLKRESCPIPGMLPTSKSDLIG